MAGIFSFMDSYRHFMKTYTDPRTADWFLVGKLGHLVLILVSYVYFCTKAGPRYMKDRKPYELKTVIQFYNLTQVLASMYLVYEGMMGGWLYEYKFACQPVVPGEKGMRMARAVWVYFMCKLVELLDTVSGHGTLLGVINSFIHVIMYTYYFLSSLGPQYQKYLWWKKHVTILQMIQFCIIFYHNFQVLFRECNFPKFLNFLLATQAAYFLYLFGCFYVNQYIKSKQRREQKLANEAANLKANGEVKANVETKTNGSVAANGFSKQNGHMDNKAKAIIEILVYSNWSCNPVDYSTSPRSIHLLRVYHLFFLTKLADLLETVFFVLRKRYRQVSFLHVYHHFGMFTMLWIAVKFFAGGHGSWVGLVNSFVHVVMYTYYMLSAIDEKWKSNVTFKKFITQVQMIQFTIFIIIYGRLLLKDDCAYPKLCSYFFVPQNFFMLLLFGDFYRKTGTMTSIMHMVVENYSEFVESRVPVVTILITYLYFVLKLGPKLMEKREPYNLQSVLVAYNAYQVLFSLWLCSQALKVQKPMQLLSHTCANPSTNREFQEVLSNGAWWYFFSKIVELLDTVFFVLRKKQSQVTFLHVYHHAITMFFSWGYLKFLPGEQGVVIGFLNSLVHVVMYFYYMTQFCIMLAYLFSIILMDCKLPKALTFFFVGNVVIFLYLFTDFYRKAYKKKPKIEAQSANGHAKTIKAQ
nr:unnamed protein product [Callosobruchus analis]